MGILPQFGGRPTYRYTGTLGRSRLADAGTATQGPDVRIYMRRLTWPSLICICTCALTLFLRTGFIAPPSLALACEKTAQEGGHGTTLKETLDFTRGFKHGTTPHYMDKKRRTNFMICIHLHTINKWRALRSPRFSMLNVVRVRYDSCWSVGGKQGDPDILKRQSW